MASNYSVHGAMPRDTEELRIVLVGKTGSGKSASGNTILGCESFKSVMSPNSVTDKCSKARATVDGQDLVVIDTPGLFDTGKDMNTMCRNISQCISYASPGPHVFLIVISLGRFTEEEMKTVELIQELFGEAADRYSMVLFTRGDDLKGTTIEEFIRKNDQLHGLVKRCHGQYHVFNNNLKTGAQVSELLRKIRNIVRNNRGSHYTSEMFQEVERAIKEEKQRILKVKEAEMRKEREQMRREIKAEFEEKLKDLEERKWENQNMELVVMREHLDRDEMQNMFKAFSMLNMKDMVEIQSQQQQHRWELEKLKMEIQFRDDAAKREREIKEQYERDLKEKQKALEEMREREAREKAEMLANAGDRLKAMEKALEEMRKREPSGNICTPM